MILPDGLKRVRNLGPWLNKNIPNPATFTPKIPPLCSEEGGLSGTFKILQFQPTPQRVEVWTLWEGLQ